MDRIKLPSYKFFENINMKGGNQKIIRRIIRLWEVRNRKNGN